MSNTPDVFDIERIATARRTIVDYAKHHRIRPLDAARIIVKSGNEFESDDLRIKRWRIRMFLFNTRDDYLADTDPALDADKPGTIIVSGINAVISYCADAVGAFHNVDKTTIANAFASRYAGLRVQLSNYNGSASWRVPYFVGDDRFTARIEIRREDGSPQRGTPPLTPEQARKLEPPIARPLTHDDPRRDSGDD